MNPSAESIVHGGLGTRYTAAVLRVERNGGLCYERAFGSLDGEPAARATEVTTRFDLASLTKIFVATAALLAVARGALGLEESLVRFFPEWRDTPHAAIAVRHMLAHTAGFASGADYRELISENVERFARTRSLVGSPGERVLYSDLGFITLGTLLARVRAASLSRVVRETTDALGCTTIAYRSRNDDAAAIPATECDAWRGRVRGSVHDEKAALMNGVAGHAGLFGTARDVARLAEVYLAAARGRRGDGLPTALFTAPLTALFNEAIAEHGADPVLRRGLGWALKTSDENSCGSRMSADTFGHTGFTGTVVWADPVRDLSVVLLTNAVYFGRHDLRDVRAGVCDAVVAEFAP